MTLHRTASLLWWVLAAMLVAAHLFVAYQSVTATRLWEDEAYNLTVPLNLVRGLGYTSDGILSGWVLDRSVLTPFDVRISTGPSVLLPAALALQIASMFGMELWGQGTVMVARIVPAAFWALLIAGLFVLGRRIAGRWGALLAAAVPLTVTALFSNSPLQGPADLLGEVASAALIVWAFVALRKRPWLAGLIFGLAIQAKYISLLAAPALVIACLVLAGAPLGRWAWREWWRALRAPILFSLVPTALYELFALFTLGLRGYGIHIVYTGGFIVGGGQPSQGTTVWQKLDTLMSAWFVPSWLAWLVAIAVALLLTAAYLVARRRPELLEAAKQRIAPGGINTENRELTALFWASLLGAFAFIGWWSVAQHTPLWVRHPAPGILAFLPLTAAFAVLARSVLIARPVLALATLSLGALAAFGVWSQVQLASTPHWGTLASQHAVAAEMRAALVDHPAASEGWVAAEPWGRPVGIGVLTGFHTGLAKDASMAESPRITIEADCGDWQQLVFADPYRLCAPGE